MNEELLKQIREALQSMGEKVENIGPQDLLDMYQDTVLPYREGSGLEMFNKFFTLDNKEANGAVNTEQSISMRLVNKTLDRLKMKDNPETKINEMDIFRENIDKFMKSTLLSESSANYKAESESSTASGGFQFLKGPDEYVQGENPASITAINRLENYLGEEVPFGEDFRESRQASLLQPSDQDALFLGNFLAAPGSDKYLQGIFEGDMETAINAYLDIHHTNPANDAGASKQQVLDNARRAFSSIYFPPLKSTDSIMNNNMSTLDNMSKKRNY